MTAPDPSADVRDTADEWAELRALAAAARMWFPADDHDGMDEVPWMDREWWQSAGLDDRHAAFAEAANPATITRLLDTLDAAWALADEWEEAHGPPTVTFGYVVHRLRAVLDSGAR